MRCLTFILAFYIFALNVLPCEDDRTFGNDHKTEISQTLDNNHQHHNADLCSPFCHCNCCHINAIHINSTDVKLQATEIFTELFFHICGMEKGFNTSILQPPRV